MDWKALLKSFAPTAASLLGGPLAGLAVKLVGEALELSEPTVEKIEQALTGGSMTPEQIVALKAVESNLIIRLRELNIKAEEVAALDRASARGMQIATRAKTPAYLSWTIVAATLFLEGWVLINGVPSNAPEVVLGRILGTLDMAFATVIAFWLGTAYKQSTRGTEQRH